MLPVRYFKSRIYIQRLNLLRMSVSKIKHTISKDINRKPGINHIKYQCFYENPAEQ